MHVVQVMLYVIFIPYKTSVCICMDYGIMYECLYQRRKVKDVFSCTLNHEFFLPSVWLICHIYTKLTAKNLSS